MANKDLPFLTEHLDHPFTFAVLKGRSNYICLQRVRELDADGAEQLALDIGGPKPPSEELAALARWSTTTLTGDRSELTIEPSPRAWAAVSVGPRECPGAAKCPKGDDCFTERARRAAADADVVVVNLHLYGMHLATNGAVLPEHQVVIIDEAHQLEDIVAATSGVELTAGRFTALARTIAAIIADPDIVRDIDELGSMWRDALSEDKHDRLAGRNTLGATVHRYVAVAKAIIGNTSRGKFPLSG